MNETSAHTHSDSHSWSQLAHTCPPKRSATERVADFLEIYGPYDEVTAREQASRCLQCPEPMCVTGCPLGNRIPEWMLLTAEGQFLEAAAISRSANNLAEICARVCPKERLCEGTCILNGQAEPVSIGAIEQFINEYAFAHGAVGATPMPPNGLRVAVVGSGPGGLACADELLQRGYAVTVFDSRLVPGGLLVSGIPAFKLDRSIVHRRVQLLERLGAVFRLGVTIGTDLTLSELREGFDAIFLGFGAQKARSLEVPGADLPGVAQAISFIIQKSAQAPLDTATLEVAGKRVVVVGGGDTAMDCLRTAIRCGAREATCVYRRDESSMPCGRSEYENAVEEGARFLFQAMPVAILDAGRGGVAGLRLVKTELGALDATGRPSFAPQPGTDFEMEADLVVQALGFNPVSFERCNDLRDIAISETGGLVVDANRMTNIPGVFAGGDIVRGPSLVVSAVRDARRAAAGIHAYLFARKVGDMGLSQADQFTP